ncbi:MMPL family transporter [Streptomyces clavuligerus]|nr:MMPL family transporter [Streptomyces clavuligerus]MBY6305191.1 MMPL family transporter [Streptomyces clavuligerus]QPL65128.1 MMPL family transporter [Streptomyces clavuligerus]QPL71159.1 MMPL family transporter [Streptomyces clavuligerus]QPL77242.1 MMPL family transporter [Streptomyces clavuligerus]QPL83266.1 MMPL family transporter [Streptomyces clavuligerus]
MRRNPAARIGVWSAHHRKAAVLGWLLFVLLTAGLGAAAGSVGLSPSASGAGESARADAILADAGLERPAGELVLIAADRPDGWKRAAADLIAAAGATGLPVRGTPPPVPSADGREALLSLTLAGDRDSAADRVGPLLDAVRSVDRAHDGVELHQFGDASSERWLNDLLADDFVKAELTAVPLALGILLAVFGAVVAALLPVVLALTACAAAYGLLALVSHQFALLPTAYSVMFLMGLAVGVDYCLFYLRRERDERAAGRDPETALRIAAATSGRTVLVSGVTVMVAMAGMFLSGLAIFEGFALATILVVFIAMLGSVTVLPALLSWLGDRVEAGRIPFLGRPRGTRAPSHGTRARRRSREGSASRSRGAGRRGRSGGSGRESGAVAGAVLGPVLARPKLFAALGAAVLLALAAPALGMRTEQLGWQKQFGPDAPLSVAYGRIAASFPGGPEPARVVVKADDITAAPVRTALARFEKVTVHRDENIAEIAVPLAGDGTDRLSREALAELREETLPAAFGSTGAEVRVTGQLAGSVDFDERLRSGIVPVLAFITGVTFLLMLFCFRSYAVALTSIVLNLLSVAAAYGVMVAVFQHGWGASLLGTQAVGAVQSWLPLFVLVVLFGLSMDYHVFVVSRIREARDRGAANREAIHEGVRRTAGAVTGAAAIMVAVFAVFGTLSMQDMKQMGVGLGVAVLLDATVVRMVLLPSVMALLGERNWHTPRLLRRLPALEHGDEGDDRDEGHAGGRDGDGGGTAGAHGTEGTRGPAALV